MVWGQVHPQGFCMWGPSFAVPFAGSVLCPVTSLSTSLRNQVKLEVRVFFLSSQVYSIVCCGSVAQSCLTLCDPVDCSMPGFPVLHHLLDFAQTHVHWIHDAIQPSHPFLSSSPPAFNLSEHQGPLKFHSNIRMCSQFREKKQTLRLKRDEINLCVSLNSIVFGV